MIAAENLGVRFANRWIFRGLDFEFALGQTVAVLGRNGSGKSTLLRVLGKLLRPTEGAVRLPNGEPRRILGYAALDMALYSDLSVQEHLILTGSLRGCPPKTEELLDFVGLSPSARVAAGDLSTGMRVRLKLAIAVQSEPSVLLLDEPSASLDAPGRKLLTEICDRQSRRGCTVLATNDPLEREVATHELSLDL
jgi:heme exporter protein A